MLDKNRQPPDYPLLALVSILTVFGLVMVYSSSFMMAVLEEHQPTYYLMRQTIWAVLGSLGLLVGVRVKYLQWKKFALPLMTLTLILFIFVLVLPESMTKGGGAERWIRLGPIGIQPSELAKFTLIIYLSSWLMGRGSKLRSMSFGFLPFGIVMGVIVGLVMLQRNLSTAVILSVIGLTVFFAAGANWLHIGVGSLLAGSLGWVLMTSVAYRMDRLRVFQDPWADARGGGFQPIHAMHALASGGLSGRGLGQSRQKFAWLPSPHADAIFSVIGEELGLIGTVGVLAAFLFFAYRGFRVAARSKEPFGALLAMGITAWISFQAFVNMAVVAQVIPFTGQTLPFISYGGSSLAMCMFASGVLLNISKHVDDVPEAAPAIPEPASQARKRRRVGVFPDLAFLRRRNGRPRVSSTRGGFRLTRSVASPSTPVESRGWQRWTQHGRRGKPTSGGGGRGQTSGWTGSWRRRP